MSPAPRYGTPDLGGDGGFGAGAEGGSAGLGRSGRSIERGPVTPGEDRCIPNDPRNAVFLRTEQQRWRDESYAYLEELKGWADPRIGAVTGPIAPMEWYRPLPGESE